MARQQLPPQIKKKVVSTDKGRDVIRYEVVVDIGDPRSGKRRQTRRRFKTEAEARAFLAPILGDRAKGLHVAPTELTVAQAVERWLAAQRVERKTREAYTNHLRPMVETYGDHPIQTITKDDIERLVSALIQGTTPRGVWSASTINPFLSRLRSVMDDLVGQGVLPRNPALLVKNVRREDTQKPEPPARVTLTAEQAKHLLDTVRDTPDEVMVMLALLGLRRAEICGLRWSNVDLDAKTVTIEWQVVPTATAGTERKKRTKTATSTRTLPLPDMAVDVLSRARTRWLRERLASGSAWEGGEDGHVYWQASGAGYAPGTTDQRWSAAVARAGLPHLPLHGGRHTAATLMLLDQTPLAVVAAWLGHANADVTLRVYAHAQKQAVEAAAAAFDGLYGKSTNRSAQ